MSFTINTKPKILSEKETREKLLNMARNLGGEMAVRDVRAIFNKYDQAVKNCSNIDERTDMAHCMAAEIHNYFDFCGSLVMSGKVIIPAKKGFEEEPETTNKITKL